MDDDEKIEFGDLDIWCKIGVAWGIISAALFLLAMISIALTGLTGAMAG